MFTDTKVPITLKDKASATYLFGSCVNLVTIRKLILEGTVTSWANAFADCNVPENITIEGYIDKNIDFAYCKKLTHDSLMNIINALAVVTSTQTITLHADSKVILTDAEKAIATQKGWTIA